MRPPHGETFAVRRAAIAVLVTGLPGEAGPLSMVPPEVRAALPAGGRRTYHDVRDNGPLSLLAGLTRRRRRQVLRARYYVG
jgi:hypothetical protein